MQFKGKVAVVTGSNSGIGLGIAEELAKLGADVALNSFTDTPEDHALAAKIATDNGVNAKYIQADMSNGDACRALVTTAQAQFGRVDILVNNAGVQFVAGVDEFPVERWNNILAINLSSAFHTSAAALPIMRAQGWGRIINIASAHGLVASPFKAPYTATKHAVVGFSKAVALEVAEQGITCNALCPGYVRTPLVEKQVVDQARVHNLPEDRVIREVILAAQPTRQFIEADEVAAFAVFLCSEAARSVTGSAQLIDGGWTAR